MSTSGAVVKRHLTEHEQVAGIATPEPIPGMVRFDEFAGIRAALRHRFKLTGLHPTDDKLHFTDQEFAGMLAEVRGHVPAQSLQGKKESVRPVRRVESTPTAEPSADKR